MDYHSVQVRKADVERLAREAGGNGTVADRGQAADEGAGRVEAAPPDGAAAAPDAQEADYEAADDGP